MFSGFNASANAPAPAHAMSNLLPDILPLQAIQSAENMGIDVYGIGICDSNVTRFYKKHVVVHDLPKLSPTILSIIDRSI